MLVLVLRSLVIFAEKLLNERGKTVLNNGSVRISSKTALAYLQMLCRHLFRDTNATDDVSVSDGPFGI